MNNKKLIKDIAILSIPILLFAVLFLPYGWVNSQFIVKWFGCGCPKVDVNGDMIHSYFNANDFTLIFWLVVSVCATVGAIFLSRRIPKEKAWLRILYIAAVLLVSLLISYRFYRMMMWN